MKFDLPTLIATSALVAATPGPLSAATIGEHASVSGFGSTAVVVTDTDDEEFVRYGQPSGATNDPEFKVDSNLGLQLDANPTNWLSGTVQLLTQQRHEENLDSKVEWAFVGISPMDGLRVRVGRTAMPVFAISDARNVGYANDWVRPPNEVYGLALLEALDGVDVSYYLPIGSSALTVTALAGESSVHVSGQKVDMKSVIGGNVQFETEWATFRIGHIEADSQLSDLGLTGEDRYSFTGYGVAVDRNNIVARSEYVTRASDTYGDLVDAKGWYLFGGYRFGSVLPYAMYASTEPDSGMSLPGQLSDEQSTIAAGVRWDAFGSATIKFQVDRIDTNDTPGISFITEQVPLPGLPITIAAPVTEVVHVATLGVDFVF